MGNIKKFANMAAYSAGVGNLQTPNVCLAESENLVIYNKKVVTDSHVAVDLGLPSGLKWANMNIGAESPEDYGLYFMWGDIVGHQPGYDFSWGNGYDSSTDKFDPTSNYGKCKGADLRGDIPVKPQYDAAMANWGKNWRMPTKADFKELYRNCEWEWTELNDINGYEVTGPNGNTIFLPAAGWCSGTERSGVGSDGYYWESTLYDIESGCVLIFNSGSVYPDNYYYRCYGYSVRPVQNLL